ncbi:MAG: STAS domain-containing protein [Rhodothermales bacterium]|jgi:anti-sigma B factor antagonist
MLDIRVEDGQVFLAGIFDASQVVTAEEVFDKVADSTVVDFTKLEYISSAGLSVLLRTQKRLSEEGGQLTLRNLSSHISDVFRFAGFDLIFQIE